MALWTRNKPTQHHPADGSDYKLLTTLAKTDLLVLDDIGAGTLTSRHQRNLLEVLEARSPERNLSRTLRH